MAKTNNMYRITWKRHCFEGNDSWTIDRILVGYNDFHKMLDNVMVHYPECMEEGNYIKIEEVVF